MEISKSTPYVRYRENISSSLHKGTVHIESEYLDRERKTTIESIEGQTWQNVVVQENKEEDLLPRLVLSVDGNTDIIDTKEERMPIDVIHGYTEPIANEDGTYTYEVSTMEGSYAQTYDGVNNIVSSSDGLEAQMSVTYATNEDNISSSVSMNNYESSYTITDSYNGEINNVVLKGNTLVNLIVNKEQYVGKSGDININIIGNTVKPNTNYTLIFDISGDTSSTFTYGFLKGVQWLSNKNYQTNIGKSKVVINTGKATVDDIVQLRLRTNTDVVNRLVLLEGDYTNVDIPYFEGMQSVKMPSLMTSGKNLFTESLLNKSNKKTINNEECFICKGSQASNSSFVIEINDGNVIDNKKQITFSFDSINPNNAQWAIAYIEYSDHQYATVKGVISSDRVIATSIQGKTVSRIMFTSEGGKEVYIKNVQIEYGSTATPYEPYNSTTLSTPKDLTLRKIGNVQDTLDLETGVYTQRIGENGEVLSQEVIKTIDLTIKNQDGKLVPKLSTYPTTTHINLSSNGLIPSADISYTLLKSTGEASGTSIQFDNGKASDLISGVVYGESIVNALSSPSLKEDDNGNNVSTYYLDMVKPNTQYTTKSSLDCNATIDGVTYPLSANGTFTTPSTITDKLMVLDAQVDDLMFIEGDLTGRNIDYFTGINSVENPSVDIVDLNRWSLAHISPRWEDWRNIENGSINAYSKIVKIMHLEPNTKYRINQFIKKPKNQVIFNFYNGNLNNIYSINIKDEMTNKGVLTTASDGDIYLRFYPCHSQGDFDIVMDTLKNSITTIYKEGELESNEEIFKGNSTQLSTTPQITLNGIGDVKDEWDVVNETVTRKVGKIMLDGSENWLSYQNHFYYNNDIFTNKTRIICDKSPTAKTMNEYGVMADNGIFRLRFNDNNDTVDTVKNKLAQNPLTIYYTLQAPTTESVRITPQNPQESTTSITLDTALQKVGNVTDQLRWNPYKGHYVRYNYIQDGVASDTYTIENLTSLNERKYVNLYNERTYIDTDHSIESHSYGISIPTIAEQGKQYQVRWDYLEAPSVDTIKVDLCGNVKEIPSTDTSVVIDVDRYTHSFVQIQAEGLTGKITNVMVIETVNGEIPDVDFFSGIQCIGNTVNIDGTPKVQIDMEQTNGNLIDVEYLIGNNGNNVEISYAPLIRPNKNYILKTKSGNTSGSYCYVGDKNKNKLFSIGLGANEITEIKVPYNGYYFRFYKAVTSNGSANMHYPFELCYADMAKDGIRPRYYDKESFILPQKLCRVGEVYDNLYYDDLKGYYRIQQSIGHKYFMGESSELWNMETTDGYRTIKFTCTNANIDMRAMGATICNGWKHLANINTDTEGFIIYNNSFIIRVDSERLNASTIVAFKEYLASNPIHLFYQLKTPTMIDLTQYPKRIELNTYRDEVFTFLKGLNPTRFTLSVPFDKTYRFDDRQEGQGYAKRVTITDERISPENVVAIQEVRGQGIANIIEDANNVPVTPQPNYSGKATSHTLNNTKPATINVHGFEPSGDTKVGTYNTTDKAYQIKVMSGNDAKSLSDYYVLNLPYQLETYADGTKDKVYYNEAYKEWHFMGGTTKSIEFTSGTGVFTEPLEVFRGLAPRTGMIAEFKLQFDGTSNSSRFYYSLDGVSYSYGSIRNIVANQDIYVAFFNTGGIKLDYATKVGADSTYDNISQIANYIPECLYINQIQTLTSCEVTIDKQYIYSELKAPISLETYDGTTKVYMDGNTTDTNIIMNNDCLKKVVNTYPDVEYTVYWKYLSGDGKLTVTLGGTKVEVDGTQEYVTVRTQSSGSQELLYVGGYNLSIQDLMVVKGAKIDELAYFEGSREVGTLVLDEEGNKSYKITLVQGGSVLEQRDNDTVAFKDDNKHNVVVHKIVGVCPTKVD